MRNALDQLITCGQSYWMDNLTRHMILSGSLKKQIQEQGLRGVTSNPAIIHKAITGSDAYETQIAELVKAGYNSNELYEALIVQDVQYACDLLRPLYEETDGEDGLVSLEISPYLAHDSDGSIEEARRLWQAVDRPNVLIKIPGTAEGVSAIEQALYEGINVNVTLLFAIEEYETVARAYLRALERRHAAGKPINRIASVASFFLSRIDVLVDQLLLQHVRPSALAQTTQLPTQLYGKVAIANAKLAYQSFKQIFQGSAWLPLQADGARVQRLLWASTGTKNPLYSDVMYVEALIGEHTVNTMTEDTMAAFADHGKVVPNSIETAVEEAKKLVFQDLPAVGIALDHVTWQLQHEGIQKFREPFDALMRLLAGKKAQEFLGDPVPSL